jgi:hypothetical protein
MSDHNSVLSNSSFTLPDLRRIRSCLNHNTAVIIATSLNHFRLDYCNSHSLSKSYCLSFVFICSSLSVLLLLSPQLHHSLTSLLFQNLFAGSKLMNASNSRFLLPTKFSRLISCSTFVIFSLYSLFANTHSSSVATLLRIPAAPRLHLTYRSRPYYGPIRWNSLPNKLCQPASLSMASSFLPA